MSLSELIIYRFDHIQTQWDDKSALLNRRRHDLSCSTVLCSRGMKISDCSDLKRLQRATEMACD